MARHASIESFGRYEPHSFNRATGIVRSRRSVLNGLPQTAPLRGLAVAALGERQRPALQMRIALTSLPNHPK